MSLAPRADYEKASCMAKVASPSLQHALNRAWLLACANQARMTVYRCSICGSLHVSSKLDGYDAILCTSPTLGVL